ncbi:hypothetical protein [Photorhabdus caribbeanensis]|nr:hypothetical protein [Photorhabdus caribbeanensis]
MIKTVAFERDPTGASEASHFSPTVGSLLIRNGLHPLRLLG